MTRIFRKKWVQYTLIIIAAVILCAFFSRLTGGFEEPINKDSFSLKLNQENLFYNKIKDGNFYTSATLDAYAEKGVITFDGNIFDSNPNTVDLGTSVHIASFRVEPGTYTFSCFDKENPSWKTYMAIATYSIGDTKYTVHADFETAPNNIENDVTKLGRTFTLAEPTTVTFAIQLMEGVSLKDVEARPLIVPGDKIGAFYSGIFE